VAVGSGERNRAEAAARRNPCDPLQVCTRRRPAENPEPTTRCHVHHREGQGESPVAERPLSSRGDPGVGDRVAANPGIGTGAHNRGQRQPRRGACGVSQAASPAGAAAARDRGGRIGQKPPPNNTPKKRAARRSGPLQRKTSTVMPFRSGCMNPRRKGEAGKPGCGSLWGIRKHPQGCTRSQPREASGGLL